MRLPALALATLIALPAAAATRYTITAEMTGFHLVEPHFRATVLADAPHRRIDIVRETTPFAYDVALFDNRGPGFIALNAPLKTWYRENRPAVLAARLFNASPYTKDAKLRDVKATIAEEPSEPIGGLATRKYVVKTSFVTTSGRDAARLDMQHSATAILWTTDAVDAALAVPLIGFTTSFAEVDAQLAPLAAKITGFPLRVTLATTETFQGGRPQTFTMDATVSDIRTVDAPPHAFDVPADYVNQPPILGVPGK